MKPLHLSMQAFGPFADLVELDFRELEGRSLFLIHGPTGAGKTSILDAICFALFGEAAGSDRKGKDARSHFAQPSVATEVILEFALGAATWRVRRVAEQPRPGGTTMKPAQASLERLLPDGTAELRAARVRDVDAAIRDLLGFEVEQFRQVVLLPQGEFRRLLVADSKDREKILETLFGAELYRRIEFELKRAGAALEREAKDAQTRVEELLRLAGSPDIDELRERCATQDARTKDLHGLAATLREQAAEAARALALAEKTAAAFEERAAATQALDTLEKDVPAQDVRRRELAAARRAQALEALVERLANARTACEREQRKQEAAERGLAGAETEMQQAASVLAAEVERAAEREAATALVQRLQQAGEAAARLTDLRRAIAAAETGLADATGAISLNGRDISYAQGRADAADKELALLRPLVAELEKRRLRVAELREVATAVEQMAAARSFLLRQSVETGGARQRLAAAETHAAVCLAAEADALRRWAGGQAALLARGLEAGQACPVCGSCEHPAPAASAEAVPSQADVEVARAATAAARAQAAERQRELEEHTAGEAVLRSNVAVLEGALGAHAAWTAGEAAGALERAEAELIESGKAHARSTELEAEKAKQLAAVAEARTDEAAARERAAEQEKILARDRAVAAELEKSVPPELAGADVTVLLRQAMQRASALSTAWDGARTRSAAAAAARSAAAASAARAVADRQEAGASLAAATAGLEDALANAGFSTFAELETARRTTAEIDALEENLRRFDEAIASARARTQRAAAAVEGLDMPDVAAVRTRADAARDGLDAVLDESSRLKEALAMAQRTLAQVSESAARMEEAGRRYRAVGRVAAVSAGNNESGISFARFVLGTLLEDVLAAATERLLRMSHGRFELVRAGDRRDRRRSGGLDLEVFDAYTGVARPAATLSGGEGFLASLSLALGLADIVQSHTGGIRLETMFIDEGFGTLDPDALDLAMGALEDLQAGGRLVGIISHVPELKERVGARLEVIPGRHGSTARFVS